MTPDFTTPLCIIYKDPIEVRKKLRDLTVPLELLIEAAQQGFVERLNAIPPFDPITAAGTDAWRYPVRAVRGGLAGVGWRLDDPRNLPLVISDERRINITVSSGDQFTGIDGHRHPRSKNPKGVLIEEAISRNTRQIDLFPERLPQTVRKFEQTLTYPTWVYLLYITDEEIRAELSLPSSMDESDYVDGWAERIIVSVPLPDAELVDDIDFDEGAEIRPVVTSKI
jgi:hypothetical protein